MSLLLFRIGRYSFAHPVRVLLAWLAVIGAVIALLATQPTSMATGLTLTDSPSQRVLDTISAEVPQAKGTQGSLVFTAVDGGRIDTPERAQAIGYALDATVATGYVVDREAKLTDQRKEVTDTITAKVEDKVSADLTPQLEDAAASLGKAADTARAKAATMPQGAALVDRVDSLARQADTLAKAKPHDQIAGAGDLFAEIENLKKLLGDSAGTMGLSLPSAPDKLTDPQAKVDQAVADAARPVLADLDRLLAGTDPAGTPLTVDGKTYRTVLVSPDHRTAVATVQLSGQVSDLPASALDEVLAAASSAVEPHGISMSATSSLLPVSPPLGGHEAIGVAIAAMVLLLTLGSLVAAGLPLLTALAGVFIGVGGAFALSANYQMTTSTPALGMMIGLAVGIDYALFIVHKHRTLVTKREMAASDAIGFAVGTAGSAVLFAGLTVVIALLGLLTLGIGFVNTMALTAAVTVTLAVLIALTALPALLGLVGERIASAKARDLGHRSYSHRIADRWVSLITRLPWLTILGVTALLALAAIPSPDLKLGMPSGAVAHLGSSQRTAYDGITHGLGEGYNAPLVVTARQSDGGEFDQEALLASQQELSGVDGVVNVALMGTSPERELAIYQVTPAQGPTADSTEALVHRLRSTQVSGLGALGVTGLTAINIDLTETLAKAIPVYVSIVLALSLLVLLIVFRSLLVPVVATAGFLLTMAATTGLVVTAFGNPQWTWLVGVDRAGPILSFLPIMATGILYGLANDYQVFLGTSIKEDHVHGTEARAAVRSGFHHAGRVVVAAAIIMVSVFGGFVLSTDTTIRQFGFALSAGILIDAFLIRMALVPAVLHIAGESAWWLPRWLDRILPAVDIEGDQLRRTQPGFSPAGASAADVSDTPSDAPDELPADEPVGAPAAG